MSELVEPYEIHIYCDMVKHPHHKGRRAHVTKLAYKEVMGVWDWFVADSELGKGSRFERLYSQEQRNKRNPYDYRPVNTSEVGDLSQSPSDLQKWMEGLIVSRFVLDCPRCGKHVTCLRDTLSFVLDQLKANGKHEVSLRILDQVLNRGARIEQFNLDEIFQKVTQSPNDTPRH